MPGRHVPDFVGNYPGHLIFGFHDENQPAVEKNLSSGYGKGIDFRGVQNEELIFKGLRAHGLKDSFADIVYIGVDGNFLNEGPALFHFQEKFIAQFALLLDRHGRGGRRREKEIRNIRTRIQMIVERTHLDL